MELNDLSKDTPQKESGDDWAVSFADMMTLLLSFFIMLIAISTVNPSKLEMVSDSLTKAVGKKIQRSQKYVSLDELAKKVKEIIKEEQLEDQVNVNVKLGGVEISAKGGLFFASARSLLSDAAKPLLTKLAAQIKEVPYQIAIEGHTDDLPISSEIFPSNWELSSARASTVVRFFIEKGVSKERLRAIGFADTRPQVENNSPENRAKNRRVVIRFLQV